MLDIADWNVNTVALSARTRLSQYENIYEDENQLKF